MNDESPNSKKKQSFQGLREFTDKAFDEIAKFGALYIGAAGFLETLFPDRGGSEKKKSWGKNFTSGVTDAIMDVGLVTLIVGTLKILLPLKKNEPHQPVQPDKSTTSTEPLNQSNSIEYREDWREKAITKEQEEKTISKVQG